LFVDWIGIGVLVEFDLTWCWLIRMVAEN